MIILNHDQAQHHQKILAAQRSVNTEERWITFMAAQNYPANSPKVIEAHRRLSDRDKILTDLIIRQV